MFSKVYIIDDDEVTLYLTSMVLSLHTPDSTCVNFQNATEALDQLQQDLQQSQLPTMVMMDLNMPVMDGFQLLEKLSGMFRCAESVPQVYVLTSSISESDKAACLQHEFVLDVLQKPLSFEILDEISSRTTSIPFSARTLENDTQ